jgi:hypothetical protein
MIVIKYIAGSLYVLLILVAERSEAWVGGRSLAGIAGSNTAGGIDVRLLYFLCFFSNSCLCVRMINRQEKSYRERSA